MAKTKKEPIDEIIKVRRKLQSKFANDKTTINSSIIYHYTSPEGILGILTNHTLWLSEITYMNDESEITYTFDLLTDILAQNNNEICQTFKDSLKTNIEKRTQLPSNLFDYVHRDSIFVACFSTKNDDISL